MSCLRCDTSSKTSIPHLPVLAPVFQFLIFGWNVWGITTLTDQGEKRKVYENDWLSLNSLILVGKAIGELCSGLCVLVFVLDGTLRNILQSSERLQSPLDIRPLRKSHTMNFKKLASTQRSPFFSVLTNKQLGYCIWILGSLMGLFNNCSSKPNGLWVNSPWGQRLNGLLTQDIWLRGIILF